MADFAERSVEVNGSPITLVEGGTGAPLLVLHEELGFPGWLGWHKAIAKKHKLIIPIQPGTRGPRIDWLRNVRDLTILYGFLLRELKIDRLDVIGFSFGGYLAAEMAVNNPGLFGKMALVAPFGVQPKEGFIMDMFPMSSAEYLRASVADPDKTAEFSHLYGEASAQQFEQWEDARTEMARIAWEPYMFDPALPNMLPGLKNLPTLIVYGDKDAILPESAVRIYEKAIPGAKLKVIKGAGHRPESENTDAFVRELETFLA
jgi:pimeloyl-ACP methyl ester carboxylesterase